MKKTFLILFSASLLLLVLSLSLGKPTFAATAIPCSPPNTCVAPHICNPSNEIAETSCTDPTPVCCKPAPCVTTNCKPSCVPPETIDNTKTCTDPNQKCCKPITDTTPPDAEDGGGDVKDQYGGLKPGGGGAGSVTIGPKDLSPVGTPSIPELIGIIVKGALGIVGSISLLLFVYGGFIMLISQGDATKITKGKNIMIWTSIGLMIIFGSYIFVSYIVTNLGQDGKDGDSGGTEEQVCGEGTLADYDCMNISGGTGCIQNLCPGGADNQCCKPKP